MAGKQRHELWAEAIRDVGILIFVFAPLDTIIRINRGNWHDWTLALLLAALGVLLVARGVNMEGEP